MYTIITKANAIANFAKIFLSDLFFNPLKKAFIPSIK